LWVLEGASGSKQQVTNVHESGTSEYPISSTIFILCLSIMFSVAAFISAKCGESVDCYDVTVYKAKPLDS
jgi:hypothetical protein